jgi:mediator of RNA polymerase II transcription subunit 31
MLRCDTHWQFENLVSNWIDGNLNERFSHHTTRLPHFRLRWSPVTARSADVLCSIGLMDSSSDVKAVNRARFELELEFVQALANPFYLHSLAQQNILSQPAFINFLSYLQYWKEKEYARFIVHVFLQFISLPHFLKSSFRYPHALHHLDLLQHATFRQEIGKDEWREYLNQKQFDHWRTWYVT